MMTLFVALWVAASGLSTIKTVKVIPVDELKFDAEVAGCVANRLEQATPLKVVTENPDAVIKVEGKSHEIPSANAGGHIYVELSDGTKIWDHKGGYIAEYLSLTTGRQVSSSAKAGLSLSCGLADDLIKELRNAMRKDRDK